MAMAANPTPAARTTVAAGVVGIVVASLHVLWSTAVLTFGLFVLGVANAQLERTPGGPLFTPSAIAVVLLVALYVALSGFELVVAIQVLKRRAWARLAGLVAFGVHGVIGLLGLLLGQAGVMSGLAGLPTSRSNSVANLLAVAVVVLLLVPWTTNDFRRANEPPAEPGESNESAGYAVLVPGQDLSGHLPPGVPAPGRYGPPGGYPYPGPPYPVPYRPPGPYGYPGPYQPGPYGPPGWPQPRR